MKYSTYSSDLLSLILIAINTVSFSLVKEKRVLAIGCDTYYRVTGQIGGCSDVSTEDARDLWIQRYSVCLQQQLSREISIYQGKVDIYYAELDKNPQQNIRFEDIVLQDEDIAPISVSQTQSTTYRGNADFCE